MSDSESAAADNPRVIGIGKRSDQGQAAACLGGRPAVTAAQRAAVSASGMVDVRGQRLGRAQ